MRREKWLRENERRLRSQRAKRKKQNSSPEWLYRFFACSATDDPRRLVIEQEGVKRQTVEGE